MKRFFLICIVAVMAVALATPAMAGLKLTSKGRMDVTAIWMSNNMLDPFTGRITQNAMNSPVDWVQQELVIDPVLHINEKVRIHSRITIMENVWLGGPLRADYNTPPVATTANYRGAENIWVERLYLSFPLFGGTFYAGRMGAGAFGYDWLDDDANGDRLKYARRVGPATVVLVWEKMREWDTGGALVQNWQRTVPAAGMPYSYGSADADLYCGVVVMPWNKSPLILTKTLICYLNWEWFPTAPNRAEGHDWLWNQTLLVKAGIFQLDMEYRIRTRNLDDGVVGPGGDFKDVHVTNHALWGEAGVHPGPFDFVLGGFWLTGAASQDPGNNRAIQVTGGEFEPYLLFFSEDMGALWRSTGVPNNSVDNVDGSGYRSIYFRAGYKINDTMSLTGIVGFLWADKMLYMEAGVNGREKGTTPDKFLGWEADLGFRWAFMDNIAYEAEVAFMKPGPYWNGQQGFNADRSVWGTRHALVINW
jgi:hypothetical protein